MDVGLGDGGDRQSVTVGEFAIDRDVPAGIDDDRLPVGLTGDEVTGVGEVGIENAFEEHGGLLSLVEGCLDCVKLFRQENTISSSSPVGCR